MRTLYHHPIHALSRTARVMLAEKALPFEPVVERPWERRTDFLKLNPAAEVPVLVEEDGTVVAGGLAVIEYLEEAYPDTPLLPREIAARAEVRRVADWFLNKFDREVTENLVGEKLIKRLSGQGHPFAPAIRAGLANVTYHLDYIAFLSERRPWLAGSVFTLADIAAAAQLSCLDYIDNVPWDRSPEAKDWYARIKSRPSFRALLADNITGCPPPKHYADLDF
ncbi:glutathione S-transferase [Azospirillum oryzae]|jgi:glutathione S-transferase|uniref:Glutathione S-transferase n=1 Tax=Azospirillum oryzae TaxID=286727 RepID=A0A1X7GAD6_9PROT|nr:MULTISPECIES: glutathione S-transferase family protein [Azospirillum]MCM8732748.1 glutathione S-transferase family protein [Azospirillum sp. A1-3]PWC69621.1 glutathione S-transferase [Azospirillum sp. TSH7]PWC69828.1 glutathione S-transferase [Azospirillum sp. TSH20]PWC97744.1 glutathione S-transferase [Azospirillum sp. TSO5]QCG97866.1 glutathione S-transferase family protein [Azospirillum sp. TSA2s]